MRKNLFKNKNAISWEKGISLSKKECPLFPETGITLIALVVTIVVLLILAGVTINFVLGENGILQQAQNAQNVVNNAIAKDKAILADLENELNSIIGGSTPVTYPVVTNGLINTGETEVTSGETLPYLPTGFSVSTTAGEKTVDEGLVIQDGSGNQYVWIEVPKSLYNNTAYNKNTVDNDMKPSSKTDYAKIEFCLKKYANRYQDGPRNADGTWNDVYDASLNNSTAVTSGGGGVSVFADAPAYNNAKNAMLASVYENGGFYIGRYEAGIESFRNNKTDDVSSITPQSKANLYPINLVTRNQAQNIASRATAGGKTASLMFGIQWDLVLKFIETKQIATDNDIATKLNSNSTTWGNYSNATYEINDTNVKYSTANWDATGNSVSWTAITASNTYTRGTTSNFALLTTGAQTKNTTDAKFVKQNIYDLAGNVWEWTLEKSSDDSHPCAVRGGSYFVSGSDSPASYRSNSAVVYASMTLGLRVSLY